MKRANFLKMILGLPLGIGGFVGRNLQAWDSHQQVLMNKFYVAGFQYYNGASIIEDIHPGETLRLAADPKSPYDKFAVPIYRGDMMLGHVPRSDNKHISRLLQQGVEVGCKVLESNPDRETWKMLKVTIYL